jgi:hypothetical protein
MKLAEALVLRADVMKRLAQVRARLMRNAKVQEGDEPAERPEELLAEYERLAHQLRELIGAINRTNCAIVFDAGTLTDALAIRDVLRLRQATGDADDRHAQRSALPPGCLCIGYSKGS